MRQEVLDKFTEIKGKHPDAIILFRDGNCYVSYGTDAICLSDILGCHLTECAYPDRRRKIKLSGFPHHSLDMYLPKIVRAGYRVAIVEELVDTKKEAK